MMYAETSKREMQMNLPPEKKDEVTQNFLEFLDFLERKSLSTAVGLEERGFTPEFTALIDSLIAFHESCLELSTCLAKQGRAVLKVSQQTMAEALSQILHAQEKNNAPDVAKKIRTQLIPILAVWKTETLPNLF